MAATTEAQSISAPPSEKQIIVHDGKRYTTVREGLAYILVPEASEDEKSKSKDGQGVQQVFYNPIQQFNRDLTVLAIKAFGKERVAQKQVDGLSRFEKSAEKKRKRKEAIHGERSAKIPKTAEDAAAPADALADAPTNGSASASTAAASTDAPAPAPEPAPAQENGAGGAAHTAPKPTKTVVQPFTILDALSASGLRALRYAHEIPFVTSVTSNDLLKAAVEAIKLNVQHNRLESKINVTHDDALAHMYSLIAKELRARDPRGRPVKSEKYDVVDLDPYGTAAPFLDAAVQSVRDDGGLLCVTCTDSGVWASNGYPEKCYSLYGGVPLKGWYSHEVGLRLILHAIETSAAKYGLAIEPLLSLSIDFYLRVFVRIRKSPARVKFQGGKNMIVYNCDSGCGAWSTQLLMRNKPSPNKKGSGIFYKHVMAQGPSVDKSCEHCGSTMHLAGPMYGGRIHSPAFVQSVLDELPEASTDIYGTTSRIRGMLQTAIEELMLSPEEIEAAEAQKNGEMDKDAEAAAREAQLAAVDPYPFYFHPAQLSGIIHCATPPEAPMRGALIRLGYRVTRSHTKPGSMKTDAPWSIIWHVMKEWARQKAPVKEKNINPGTIGYRILGLGEKQDDAAPAENGKEEEEEKKKKKKKQVEMPEVVFDEKLGQDLMKTKFVRYQMNPRENWGPMNRASGH
ncbi:S-adenosyl-L-methionine-dependent methyltransferase [Podospora appendiculata]|uniref:tRNA (guanine(26)-N(2))-dimethyltransferase n=1 Tax=Podospora appendiculata TaxID=314037 RepID=A0AAE1CBC1_9PEZI|nr:S-adenosyl-L-methionine-dependent methyltransferase [Podospora appendiculata]